MERLLRGVGHGAASIPDPRAHAECSPAPARREFVHDQPELIKNLDGTKMLGGLAAYIAQGDLLRANGSSRHGRT